MTSDKRTGQAGRNNRPAAPSGAQERRAAPSSTRKAAPGAVERVPPREQKKAAEDLKQFYGRAPAAAKRRRSS